ncbi:FecR domain-containing protein [Ramlibacter sp.]|uniref:FecR domain-containing protein n=1 Tax=Ramlibacter sp. TaxID=1917967 RepID=UPI0035B20945
MSPPIPKDWWLAAALTGAALPSALAQTTPPSAQARGPAGVITTTEPGKPAVVQPLYMEAARGQKVVTGPNQTVHVLFPDQSAVTVGPNSEVAIARLEYDAQKKEGSIALEFTRGFLRVVGGVISKRNEVLVRTATATVGIRGGISTLQSNGPNLMAQFLFGLSMSLTNNGNNGAPPLIINRPGFGVMFGPGGLGQPIRLSPPPPPAPPPGPAPGPAPGPSQGGGTLPGGGTPAPNLSPDRLGGPSTPPPPSQGGNAAPPTLQNLLGSGSIPNQS